MTKKGNRASDPFDLAATGWHQNNNGGNANGNGARHRVTRAADASLSNSGSTDHLVSGDELEVSHENGNALQNRNSLHAGFVDEDEEHRRMSTQASTVRAPSVWYPSETVTKNMSTANMFGADLRYGAGRSGVTSNYHDKYGGEGTVGGPAGNNNNSNMLVSNTAKPPSRWRTFPYFLALVTLVHIAVFGYQLAMNKEWTGSLIAPPAQNWMIGPTTGTLIATGARWTPCMRGNFSAELNPAPQPPSTPFLCEAFGISTTSSSSTANSNDNGAPQLCTAEQICGMDGFKQNGGMPNQWWRFITPIFAHVGVIHLLLNLLFQCTAGFALESAFGTVRIALIWLASGIGGNIFGANFAAPFMPSVGASGSLFGLIGLLLVDIIQSWKHRTSPVKDLVWVMVDIIISFLLGLFGFIDNFAHLGGLITGILASVVFIPTKITRPHYKVLKWIFIVVALGLVAGGIFAGGLIGFYNGALVGSCPGCKYLSCVPVIKQCDDIWDQYGTY